MNDISLTDICRSIIASVPEKLQRIFFAGGQESCDNAMSLDYSTVVYWIIFFVLLSVVFVYILCKSRIIEKLSKHILSLSLFTWFLGVVVYIIGFYDNGINGLSVILRAIISSFKMFVVSNDLARVSKLLQTDTIYMTVFSILHFTAAFITFLFIFKMVGYKIKSTLKIITHKWLYSRDRVVHLFWGVNEASLLMAESIHRNSSTDTIIFVDIDKESEDNTQKKTTLSNITNTITIRNSEIARLEAVGAHIDHCYNGPASQKSDSATDIFGNLHLKNIGAIIQKSRKSHFYFLSNDEDENIAGALNLQRDRMLARIGKNKSIICVHAHRDANNEVLDHYSQYDNDAQQIRIKIVDSAYLSIVRLKQDDKALPVNCVNRDSKTGVVDSPFTSLIVGFGGTGREAFKFLYEYSAFIDSKSRKSPFKCYVIDEKMDRIAGLVREKMPAIGNDELSLIHAPVDSEIYWTLIKKIIKELNYVVIALNDDTLGLSIAVDLFRYALKSRTEDSPKLKIMVRCYDNGNEKRMTEVANNLNKSIENNDIEIMLYGKEKELYCCDTILSDVTLQEAKEFNKAYKDSELSADELWQTDFGKEEIERLMKEKGLSRYHAIYDINRRIAQNISNSLHARTKMILLGFGKDELSERLREYHEYANSRERDTINYPCSNEAKQLLHNIAMVEHERWIASHKLMGYTYGPMCDVVHKYHDCITGWENINDEKTFSYDCNVVDTTIKLAYQKATSKKN